MTGWQKILKVSLENETGFLHQRKINVPSKRDIKASSSDHCTQRTVEAGKQPTTYRKLSGEEGEEEEEARF